MASTIVTKNSSTASAVPVAGDLTKGELAVNVTDKKLYTKDNGGSVVKLVGSLGNQEASAVAVTGGAIDGTTVGSTTAAAGAFTTLAASSNVTLSGGTANGVLYLNGSKVATSGSALTFDGTNLTTNAIKAGSNSGDVLFGRYDATYPTSGIGFFKLGTNNYDGDTGGFTLSTLDNGTLRTSYQVVETSGSASYHTWYASGSEQMRLTSTGLGIGTSSWSTSKLYVLGNTTNYAITSEAPNGYAALNLKQTSGNTMSLGMASNGLFIYDNNAGTTRLTLDSSGNLGIGTSSPWAKLSLAMSNGQMGLANGNTSGGVKIQAWNAAGNADGYLAFEGYTKEYGRFDSSGNLGLGVTPSAWSGYTALQVSYGFSVWSSGVSNSRMNANTYYNGGYKYVGTGTATMYEQDGYHAWYTAASGTAGNAITFTQAMTLDASGRLLIGGTSTYDFNGQANLVVNGTDDMATITIASTNTGYLAFADGTSGTDRYTGSIQYSHSSNAMLFSTNGGVERARIDSSGNLLVGTTSGSQHKFFKNLSGDVATWINNSATSNPYGLYLEFSGASPNDASRYFLSCTDSSSTNRAQIRSNGGIANYQANDVNLSDRREKTNFAPAKSYLDTICAIPVQTFNYIDQNLEEDAGLTLGVVAQDVQAVAPELVMESNWGTEENPKMRLSIYQTDLQYALMKCIQEQQALIQQLTARVAQLESN